MKVKTTKTGTKADGGRVFTTVIELTRAEVQGLRDSDLAEELRPARNLLARCIDDAVTFQLTQDINGDSCGRG